MPAIDLAGTIARRRTLRDFADRPVPLEVVRRLLWAAQGITDDEGRRAAPSAHGLHPLRLLLVAGAIDGLATGLHSVGADAEALSPVTDHDVRPSLEAAALEDQPWIGRAAGIIAIAADMVAATSAFADQPPYGTRGVRYVHIEAGAAAQNILLAATVEGLACVLVAGFRDEATAEALGLDAPLAPVLYLCFGWPADA